MESLNMLLYSWKSIKNHFRSSLLFICALSAIFITSPLSLSMLQHIQAKIDSNIEKYARGSYDLLIRPAEAQTTVEKERGVVEENYLGLGEGGISIDEWRKIKALNDVEVAAPVASLGYFTGEHNTMGMAFPESSSLIEVQYQTSDGMNVYNLDTSGAYYMLEQEGYYDGFDFVEQGNFQISSSGSPPMYTMPVPYHLAIGIDQVEEEKLTGFDLSALSNSIPRNELQFYEYLNVGRYIPIIYLADSHIPLTALVTVSAIDWTTEDTIRLKDELNVAHQDPIFVSEEFRSLFKEFSSMDKKSSQTITIDLSKHMKPFSYEPFSFDYDGNVIEPQEYTFGVNESSRFYKAAPIDYDIHADGQLSVKQVGVESGVPVYREIEQQGGAAYEIRDIPFFIFPVGNFTTEAYQDSLSASPLGIYQQAPSTLADGTVLHETITPGSFVSAPAHGLMSLEDAAYIKGDTPIDAIRLRVADIATYDQSAIEKISQVASDIAQLGDYQIDVVAGASPTTMVMDVEGIGEVHQPWTSLGAAATIRDGWNGTNMLIAGIFLLAGMSYLTNRLQFRRRTKREEKELLLDLGWRQDHIRSFYMLENVLLIILSAGVASLILLGFVWSNQVDWVALLFFVGVVAVTVLFSWINVLAKKRERTSSFESLKGDAVWVRNLSYYRRLLSLSVVQLASVALLMSFVISSIEATIVLTGETNLGSFVNDAVFIPLVAVMIAALLLATLTVGESTSSFLILRKGELETLRDTGWRMKDVQRLCMKESAFWTISAVSVGVAISIILATLLHSFSFTLLLVAGVTMVLLCSIAIVTAFFMIRSAVQKIG